MSSNFEQKVYDFFKNYQDRGMKKWAGFYLSDHTLKINKDEIKRSIVYAKKKEMSQEEIGEVLFKAFSNHLLVHVQIKSLDKDGNFTEDISGFVEGYTEESVIISSQSVKLNEINNVEL